MGEGGKKDKGRGGEGIRWEREEKVEEGGGKRRGRDGMGEGGGMG